VITAVDTNILIDVFAADKTFGEQSAKLLKQCIQEGVVCACEIVWTETATVFPNRAAFNHAIETLGIEFSPMQSDAAIIAATAWRQYRDKGGKRERVVADFLIGAHGITQCDRLLTRDRGFYRHYFSALAILDPSVQI